MILRVLTIDMFAVSFCSIEVLISVYRFDFFKDASGGVIHVQMDGFNYLEQNGWTLLMFQYEIVGVSPPILGYLHVFCYMTCK